MGLNVLVDHHLDWLAAHVGLFWMVLAGAIVRLLLITHEPRRNRIQNGLAGVVLALTLTDLTASVLTNGKYAPAYALAYAVVGRELVMAIYQLVIDKAYPLLSKALDIFTSIRLGLGKTEDKKNGPDESA